MNTDAKQLEDRQQYGETPPTKGQPRSERIEALVLDGSPEVVLMLAEAITQIDGQARTTLVDSLRGLADQPWVDSAWAIWATTRHAGLAALLTECGWVASAPKELKVFSALKAGRLEVVTAGGVEVVTPLLQACEDADSTIAGQARLALQQLKNVEAQETLCHLVIQHDHPLARETAVAAQYAPRDKVQRALFYFLTDQWDKYENLDFDQSLLKAVYEVADRDLLRRLAERARRAGRAEWVDVVAGGRQGRRLGEMTDGEREAVLAVLVKDGQWSSMWRLAQVAPPVWSVRLLRRLKRAGWAPEEGERTGFAELVRLAENCTGESPEIGVLVYCLDTLKGHNHTVRSLVISPNGRILASGSGDRTVRLWHLPSGQALKTLTGHTKGVNCMAVSPDGQVLATGSDDKTVRLWRLPDGQVLKTLTRHTSGVTCLTISPDGRLLVSGSRDKTVHLWNLPDGQVVNTLKGHTGPIKCIAISPNGWMLASGSLDGTVRLWSLPDGKAVRTLEAHRLSVNCLVISPDGRELAGGNYDGTVRLWRLPKGSPLKPLEGQGHTREVRCLAISSDGRVLASGGDDGTVHLWDFRERRVLRILKTYHFSVNCLAMSPDGRVLTSGGYDNKVRLWELGSFDLSRLTVGQMRLKDLTGTREVLRDGRTSGVERLWLEFILALIRWHRRFDIEVEEMPRRITVGEFDIEID